MQVNVIPGKTYAVSSSADCTVTCEHNGLSYTLCTASGGQAYFVPPVDTVTISDDTAIVTETFNAAPMAASGGGGGGTGVSITIDQAFSATSENAQSGVAVAKAFSAYNVRNQGSAVCLGQNSGVAGPGRYAIAIGSYTSTGNYASPLAVGALASCNGDGGISIGANTKSSGAFAAAIGSSTKNNDKFTTVIGAFNSDNNTMTQLYLIAAGSQLAEKYEDGASCIGYVLKDSSGTVLACGTKKLSELLNNNTMLQDETFMPTTYDLRGGSPPTPGPFLPTGIMEPIDLDEFPNQ